jgi:2-polyprenyl-3-methyl-5-hydroxy-6-metoxy-1,4-benzoquinol methylase
MMGSFLRYLAGAASRSIIFRSGARLWEKNLADGNLQLTKAQKLITGLYIILRDYQEKRFPPRFDNQNVTYAAELNYHRALPGMSPSDFMLLEMRKPFWPGYMGRYLSSFVHVAESLQRHRILPPSKVLELGCGNGWMAEFLAILGYDVLGTSLVPDDIVDARKRTRSIEAKGLPVKIDFQVAAMESVDAAIGGRESYDAVFVFEALHHAHDWRSAILSAYRCLKPGGRLFLFNEPNAIHTFVAYRIARITHTHEIGFWPSQVQGHLKQVGFKRVAYLKNRLHFYIRSFSMVAQK